MNPCPTCGNYKNRAVSIDALIVRDGNILLIKRGIEPYKDFWGLPGGHLDFDEKIEDAVRREVKEETGLVVTSLLLHGIYDSPSRHPKQSVAISYITETIGEPKAGDDAAEVQFFLINNLPSELAFDHNKIIADYLKKTK